MLTLLSARKLLSATITSQVLIYTCRFTHTVNRFKNKLFRPHGLNVYIKPVYIHRGGKSIYQVQVFGHLLQLPPKTRHINLPLTSAKQHKPVCLWVCSRVVRQPSKMLASPISGFNKQACNQISQNIKINVCRSECTLKSILIAIPSNILTERGHS